MADEEIGTIFDNRSADLIAQVTRTVLGQVKNYLSARQTDNSGGGSTIWHNASGSTSEDIPGRSIVALTTEFTWCDGFPLYRVVMPTTTYTSRYAIVHPAGIKRNDTGWVTFEGPCEQVCTSSTISKGSRLGPKAGQYEQVAGYPATSLVDAVITSSGNPVYWGPVHPIREMIGKSSTTPVSIGATTNWRIYGGTPGSEVDIGVATPSAVSRTTVAIQKFVKVTAIGDGLELEHLEC